MFMQAPREKMTAANKSAAFPNAGRGRILRPERYVRSEMRSRQTARLGGCTSQAVGQNAWPHFRGRWVSRLELV